MDYEDLMKVFVGECGIFQILALLLCSISNFLGVEVIFHNFIAAYQEHWCYIPDLKDVPYDQQRYKSAKYGLCIYTAKKTLIIIVLIIENVIRNTL